VDSQHEAPPEPLSAKPGRPDGYHSWPPGLPLISYGLSMGLVTTATGALVASGAAGTAQVIIWIVATAVLAGSAVLLAEPTLSLLGRCLRWGLPHRPRS
jgi:hypothetical protein